MNKKELDLQQSKALIEMNEKLDKILSLLDTKKKKAVKK